MIKKVYTLILIILAGFYHAMPATHAEPNIMVLHSYHPSFHWNIEINQGLRQVLSEEFDDYHMIVEYLDSKRIFDETHQTRLLELYLHKYNSVDIDAIIVSDDDALQFILMYGQELFPDVPVVFCGVNNYSPSYRDSYPHLTGVVEKLDEPETISMALQLFPETEYVYFVGDQSTTAFDLTAIFKEKHEQLFPDIEFNYLHTNKLEKLPGLLDQVPRESVIMLWPYLQQKENHLIEVDKATRAITSYTNLPVFGFWHFMLSNGIIGGKLAHGVAQGEMAAHLAVSVLKNGERAENLAVVKSVPNDFFFDYNVLKLHDLDIEALPENSIIINMPESFLSKNRNTLLGFLAAMIVFGLLYLIYTIHNRNIRRVLTRELAFQQSLINALPNPVFYTFDNKHIEGCNQAFEKLTGITIEPGESPEFNAVYVPGQADVHKSVNAEIMQSQKSTTYEGQIIACGNTVRDVIFYKSVLYNTRTKKYGVIESIVDITDKKNATERIRLSEERYALATKATKDGIWDWDLQKGEIFLSDNLKEMLGYDISEEPMDEENMRQWVHPEDLNIFNHQMDLLQQGVKDSYNLEMRLKQKNGSYFWAEVKTFSQRDKNNDICRQIGSISNIQQRKDAELSLKKWEEIFQNTLMGVSTVNPYSKEIEVMNPVFAHIHGYQPDELKGKTITDLRAPEAGDDMAEIFEKVNLQGHQVQESLHIRKDYSTFPVMVDITAVKNDRDEIQYYIVNLQDITQRKKQEDKITRMLQNEQTMNEELRSSEEEVRQTLLQTVNLKEKLEENQKQFLSFIDGTSDFAILKDENLRYLLVNKAYADLYHLDPEEIIGKTDEEITPESVAKEEQKTDLQVLKENKTVIYERETNGKIFETRKFPVFYLKKQIGVGAFIRDITQQRIIEQQVQKNEQRFRTLLENSYDLITLINKKGEISYSTDAIKSLTGWTNREVKGKHLSEILHPEDKTLFFQKIEKLLQSPAEPISINHRFNHNRERIKNIETIATNHLNNPLINAIVLTSRDVSLEHQSRELKKNISIAQKSAEIKQQFLANMSHEIRTPMNGIVGMIEFLLETKLDETQLDYVNTIKSSADSLLNIINDILDFSKIEAGKLSINPAPVNIRNFLKEAPKVFKALVKQKNLEFNLFIDDSLPEYLNLDSIRLNQVVSNLLSNAIKFTSSGEVALRVFAEKSTHAMVHLRFEVQDTGIGIPEEKQKNLFTPFTQIDSSLTRSQEGTGLGLTICQRIINLMDGEIGIISKKGQGALFWFTIPAAISGLEKVKKFTISHEAREKKKLNINVLLVEDKKVNQKVFKLMMESMGCKVTIAADGQQAINIIESYQKGGKHKLPVFQAILMDIQMPVMDGIAATRIIREKHPEYKVIIGLSANVFSSEVEGFLRSGLDDYIVKPAKSEELYKKLLYWTQEREVIPENSEESFSNIIDHLSREPVYEKHSLDIIKAQAKNNTLVLQELFSSFLNDAIELISNLESEAELEDNIATDYLKTLKNMSLSMGALQVSKTCDALIKNLTYHQTPDKKLLQFLKEAVTRYVGTIKDNPKD